MSGQRNLFTDISISELQELILKNLTEDLLIKGFTYDENNPTKGFCYVATEAFYHLKGKDMGFFPVRGKDRNGIVHWWLENGLKTRIDVTRAQYREYIPPYDVGVRGGFLTKEPSKRTKKLMEKIMSIIVAKECKYDFSNDEIDFDDSVWIRKEKSPTAKTSLHTLLELIDKKYKYEEGRPEEEWVKLKIYMDGSGEIYRGILSSKDGYDVLFEFDSIEELLAHLEDRPVEPTY